MSRVKYPEVDLTPVRDDVMHVAVGRVVKESESNLRWALRRIPAGGRIRLIHVHQPDQPDQSIPISKVAYLFKREIRIDEFTEDQVRRYYETERKDMQKTMDKYMLICQREEVLAEKLVIERGSVEKGIVELIRENGIRKLVMGAPANSSYYFKNLTEPSSLKSIYIFKHAPDFCQIWFVCKGQLVRIRDSEEDFVHMEVGSPASVATPIAGQFSPTGYSSATEGQTDHFEHSVPENNRRNAADYVLKHDLLGSQEDSGGLTLRNILNMNGSSDSPNGIKWRIPSGGSNISTGSSRKLINDSASSSGLKIEGTQNRIVSQVTNDRQEFYDLQHFVADAQNSKLEAYERSLKRNKAKILATDTNHEARSSEFMYAEELRRNTEIKEALSQRKEEVKRMKEQVDAIMVELHVAHKSQIAQSDLMVEELEQKIFYGVDMLQKYKKERDELEVERDNALLVAEELREKLAAGPASDRDCRFFTEFSFPEIKEATGNFDPGFRIGEGGFGSIYKGLLRHTRVAIKMLRQNSLQGPIKFQLEVDNLSKLRHPNLVTLIGACPDSLTLVYEYLPSGSLEDRLNCKDNTPPLSWQTRICIAAELCSVLIFLHSSRPQGIIHGDLKPANILLDANHQSKLSDFGISNIINQREFSGNNTILSSRTDPRGSFAYMNPEFLATGELTDKSNVYSFGVIILRLLTGKPALGIKMEVQYALNQGNLKDLLDPTAGDWPFVQAKQLAHLAMNCCEMKGIRRPELGTEVWRLLEPMRASCEVSSSRLEPEEMCQIPSYFICPISQELMKDPVMAADGFTYEAEALKEWLGSGHDTSPMTNLKLTHCNLVPNRALRSAIQEWLQINQSSHDFV